MEARIYKTQGVRLASRYDVAEDITEAYSRHQWSGNRNTYLMWCIQYSVYTTIIIKQKSNYLFMPDIAEEWKKLQYERKYIEWEVEIVPVDKVGEYPVRI